MSSTDFSNEEFTTALANVSENVSCMVSNRTYHHVEMSINTASLAVNLFLCLSIIVYRRKLRQHIINLYAANIVFSNFVLIAAFTITSYLEYFGYSRKPDAYSSIPLSVLYFWFVMKVCSIVMFLVICAGIGLLIVAMKKNMFRVHRTVAGLSRDSVQTLHVGDKATDRKRNSISYRLLYWIKRNPKRFARLEIALVWSIPIFLSTASYHDKASCLRKCSCVMNYIPASPEHPACPKESSCNELIPSLNNVTIIVVFSFWIICVSAVLLLFVRSYFHFLQIMSERKEAIKAQSLDSDPRKRKSPTEKISEKNSEITNPSPEKLKPSTPNLNRKSSTMDRMGSHFSWHHHHPKSLLSESLKKNILFLVLIAVIFIVGTGPFVITSFLSVFYNFNFYRSNGAIVALSGLIPLSTLFNSFVLCGSHFGLNIAVRSMVRAIAQCLCFGKKK